MKVDLYYYEQCPFCYRVLMKIKELGLEEKINFKNTLESAEHREFHIKQTGRTTVPCLYIDGKPMFESNDINNWLEQNIKNI